MNQLQQGILLAGAGIGYLFIFVDLFGRLFVCFLILLIFAFFGAVFWKKNSVDWKKKEFENALIVESGRVIAFDSRYAGCPQEPFEPAVNTGKTIETGSEPEPVQTGYNGEIEAPNEKRVEDFHGEQERIPDEVWPDEINLESEKIYYLDSLGWSKNAICFGVYGCKNGLKLKNVNEVLG